MKNFIVSLFCLTSLVATVFAGPPEISSKEAQTYQAPAVQFYGDREWNIDLFGAYAFTGNSYRDDRYLNTDHAFGGGIDANYMFTRYLGAGLEGYALDADDVIGQASGNLVFRYPFPNSRFAPYGYAGGGVIFNGSRVEDLAANGQSPASVRRDSDAEGLGQLGAGFEIRITRHIGLINDFSWNIVDGPDNNFGMFRSGIRFAF